MLFNAKTCFWKLFWRKYDSAQVEKIYHNLNVMKSWREKTGDLVQKRSEQVLDILESKRHLEEKVNWYETFFYMWKTPKITCYILFPNVLSISKLLAEISTGIKSLLFICILTRKDHVFFCFDFLFESSWHCVAYMWQICGTLVDVWLHAVIFQLLKP